jgi:hypothetical protein
MAGKITLRDYSFLNLEDFVNIFESEKPVSKEGIRHYRILERNIFLKGCTKTHMKIQPLLLKESTMEIIKVFEPVHIFEWQHEQDKIIY